MADVFIKKAGQHHIQFEHAASAVPAKPVDIHSTDRFTIHVLALQRGHGSHTVRFTSSDLILPIACVGLSSFGQTSTQFMMLWQRNNR